MKTNIEKLIGFYWKYKGNNTMQYIAIQLVKKYRNIQWWFVNLGSDSPEISLVRTKSGEQISASELKGDSVICKTH